MVTCLMTSDPEMETVASRTGRICALADDCVAKVARLLGKKADAKPFGRTCPELS